MSYNEDLNTQIVVTSASQLAGTLRSDVVYFIDGQIDLWSVEITVPEEWLFLRWLDYFISGLYTTAPWHTMFKTATYSGNIKMSNLYFWSSGTGSKIFDLDNAWNSGAIEFQSVNLWDFGGATTSLWEIANYRQIRTNDAWFFRIQDWLALSGTWAWGFRFSDTISLAWLAGSTLFKEWAGLTFAGRSISDINAGSLDPTITVFEFQESNFLTDGGFQLNGASFASQSAVPNISQWSTKALFKENVGIKNTNIGASMSWDTSPVVTFSAVNTPVKVWGTTITTNNDWFTQTANNTLTCNTPLTNNYNINLNVEIRGSAGNLATLYLRKWDDSAGSYVTIKSVQREIVNVIVSSDPAFFNFQETVELSQNDRIEIWIENNTNTNSITFRAGSSYRLTL